MNFAWPWCFLLLPLPWLVRWLLPPVSVGRALRVPSLSGAATSAVSARTGAWFWIALMAWALLVTAAARPHLATRQPAQMVEGRDLMLAFDVSASMATRDLNLHVKPLRRLDAARTVAGNFLERRKSGDRVGLIVFGAQAYLYTPLTEDIGAVRQALKTLEPGLAGNATALGDAVALAIKHMAPIPEKSRGLVLLTDGVNNAGTLLPARAAWLARRDGLHIHALGIGASPRSNGSSRKVDANAMDEEALRAMAGQTGGSFAIATDSAAMERFFQLIDGIEPVSHGAGNPYVWRELYMWPLGAGLSLAALLLGVRLRENGD